MTQPPLILRNRDFGLLWFSQVISQAGNRMFQIAIMWWVLSAAADHAGMHAAFLMVVGAIPGVLFVKHIGSRIDASTSRRILLTTDAVGFAFSLILYALSLNGITNIYVFYVFCFIFALFQAFIGPTLMKAVPEVVAAEDTMPAVGFLSTTQTLANFGGAVAGAALIEWLGLPAIILINGMTYGVSILCDASIRFKRVGAAGQKPEKIPVMTLLNRYPVARNAVFAFAILNFFGTPILLVLPLYTKTILAGTGSLLAILESCIWLGMLTGAGLARYLFTKTNTLIFISYCLLVFGAGIALPGVLVAPLIYGLSLFITGAALGILNVRIIVFFQEMIDPAVKGRFFAIVQGMTGVIIPMGFLTFGALSETLAIKTICLVQGMAILLIAPVFLLIARQGSVATGEVAVAEGGGS